MKTKEDRTFLPDVASVPSEIKMGDKWDTQAVADLIQSKRNNGEIPAFLFLGAKEANLLRAHLAEAFGAACVTTLHDTYYMCLEVIVIDCESFLRCGGRKMIRTLQETTSRNPAWSCEQTEAMWQLRP